MKPKNFIANKLWSFFYSVEVLKEKFEEIWIQTNILSSSHRPFEVLGFYMHCRKIMLETSLQEKLCFLDEIQLNFKQLNEVFIQIFGAKTSRKVHLLRNVNELTKASSVMSNILIDWLAQKKKHTKIKSTSVKRQNPLIQRVSKSPNQVRMSKSVRPKSALPKSKSNNSL